MGLTLSATIDDDGLGVALAAASDKARAAAKKIIRTESLIAERIIKDDMPVDTGRARASWGHYSPGDVKKNPESSEEDSVWLEENDGLTITQGSNVEYIQALNEGHSQQMGAGFIDAAAQTAAVHIIDGVNNLILGIF